MADFDGLTEREIELPKPGDIDPRKLVDAPTPKLLESQRWYRQAQDDFDAIDNDVNGTIPAAVWACIKCLQVAEKALKAGLYNKDANDDGLDKPYVKQTPCRTHDLRKLALKLGGKFMQPVEELVQRLGENAYITTRYPGYKHKGEKTDGKIPSQLYTADDASESKQRCEKILSLVNDDINP